jgi:hypothetical protein
LRTVFQLYSVSTERKSSHIKAFLLWLQRLLGG